jgi:hypothetical protein
MPMRRRSSFGLRMSATLLAVDQHIAGKLALPMKSSVRLTVLSSVVLPELAGPMMPKSRCAECRSSAVQHLLRAVDAETLRN